MKILLTNDDGIMATGILTLAKQLYKHHHITIVAPDSEKSAASHSITIRSPLRYRAVALDDMPDAKAYAVAGGSPADCVKMALYQILPDDLPDWVISGINYGFNSSAYVLYSGTVAGATEGALRGIRSIAISTGPYTAPDFAGTAQLLDDHLKAIDALDIPQGTVLNINVPHKANNAGQFPIWSSLGIVQSKEGYEARRDPYGGEYFWFTSDLSQSLDYADHTDEYWLSKGYSTITPLSCDHTNHAFLAQMQSLSWRK